ncbi:MAG: hypothetical protein ABIP53_03365 [Candidatus Limnocylindrales bacterium]
MTKPNSLLLAMAATALIVACGGAATPTGRPGSPAPTPAPTQMPSPTATTGVPMSVTSPAQAAALVFASDARWAAMAPFRADIIGASIWFETFSEVGGYGVRITAGEGDCESGCIERHTWTYHVDNDGTVGLVGEEGDDIDVQVPPASTEPSTVRVVLTAGPVCPVERDPPDPACAPRPVANATVTLFAADGSEIASTLSGADGTVAFELDAGAYYVVAEPVQGLMGTPEAQAFSIVGGTQLGLAMGYDTGIR